MRRHAHLLLLATVLLLIPATVSANMVTLRLSYFIPTFKGGPDSLWRIEFDNMSFEKSDYAQGVLGFSYEYFLTREISLALSIDTYSRNKAGFYRDYIGFSFEEGDFAFPADLYTDPDFTISHIYNVSITPIQLSAKFTPLGRRIRLIPYVGGGVGMFFWNVRLRGDFVDFADDSFVFDDPDIGEVQVYPVDIVDAREDNRITFGTHVFGGLMYPIGNRLTVNAEFRYNWATGVFKESFEGFEDFDLGGYVLTAGLNYWF